MLMNWKPSLLRSMDQVEQEPESSSPCPIPVATVTCELFVQVHFCLENTYFKTNIVRSHTSNIHILMQLFMYMKLQVSLFAK